jgi:hypothetical protein
MADLVRASGPDGEGRAITLALEDVALAVTGHLGFLAEAQLTGTVRPRIGNHLYGGFARDFRTAGGDWGIVVTLTARHFAGTSVLWERYRTFAELAADPAPALQQAQLRNRARYRALNHVIELGRPTALSRAGRRPGRGAGSARRPGRRRAA